MWQVKNLRIFFILPHFSGAWDFIFLLSDHESHGHRKNVFKKTTFVESTCLFIISQESAQIFENHLSWGYYQLIISMWSLTAIMEKRTFFPNIPPCKRTWNTLFMWTVHKSHSVKTKSFIGARLSKNILVYFLKKPSHRFWIVSISLLRSAQASYTNPWYSHRPLHVMVPNCAAGSLNDLICSLFSLGKVGDMWSIETQR